MCSFLPCYRSFLKMRILLDSSIFSSSEQNDFFNRYRIFHNLTSRWLLKPWGASCLTLKCRKGPNCVRHDLLNLLVIEINACILCTTFWMFCIYQTRWFPLREEHKLQAFEDKVLRKVFRARKGEASGVMKYYRTINLSAIIVLMVKQRRQWWAGHAAW